MNTLRPRPNCCQFPDDTFNSILLYENIWISIKSSLNAGPKGPINNIVCFITKSFLTYSFFPPTPALSTISRPLSSYMCSITPEAAKVGSSCSPIRGPGIGCWFSTRSNCSRWSFETAVLPINPSIYTDQWEPIIIYHSIILLVLIQLCSPRCWHLHSNYCIDSSIGSDNGLAPATRQ